MNIITSFFKLFTLAGSCTSPEQLAPHFLDAPEFHWNYEEELQKAWVNNQKKSDIKSMRKSFQNPLFLAAANGRLDIITYYLEALHGNPDIVSTYGSTLLIFAAWNRRYDLCAYLIKNKASVNVKNNFSVTALEYACNSKNNIPVIKLLLKNGSQKCATSNVYFDVSDVSSIMRQLLLYHVYDITSLRSRYNLKNPDIHFAFAQANAPEIEACLEKDPTALYTSDVHGNQPLVYAATQAHPFIVEFLIYKKVSVYHKNHDKKTALQYVDRILKNNDLDKDSRKRYVTIQHLLLKPAWGLYCLCATYKVPRDVRREIQKYL